jgi:hypothetical protein
VGLKVTLTVQEAAAANELPQVLVSANTALMLAMLSPAIAVIPPFLNVKLVAKLVVPCATEPNP